MKIERRLNTKKSYCYKRNWLKNISPVAQIQNAVDTEEHSKEGKLILNKKIMAYFLHKI
jgi:hypothetical protein